MLDFVLMLLGGLIMVTGLCFWLVFAWLVWVIMRTGGGD
jgi:hypothetical protein